MSFFELNGKTIGMDDFQRDVVRQTLNDAVEPVEQGALLVYRRLRVKLGRKPGPSRPGDPPAEVQGHLKRGMGASKAKVDRRAGTVTASVGLGAGQKAIQQINRSKSQGVNPFEYYGLMEYGGIGADSRRYPPRPSLRPTVAAAESAVVRLMEAAL